MRSDDEITAAIIRAEAESIRSANDEGWAFASALKWVLGEDSPAEYRRWVSVRSDAST